MIAITGNTFPVKDQIKALGGRWNAECAKCGCLTRVIVIVRDEDDELLYLCPGCAESESANQREGDKAMAVSDTDGVSVGR